MTSSTTSTGTGSPPVGVAGQDRVLLAVFVVGGLLVAGVTVGAVAGYTDGYAGAMVAGVVGGGYGFGGLRVVDTARYRRSE